MIVRIPYLPICSCLRWRRGPFVGAFACRTRGTCAPSGAGLTKCAVIFIVVIIFGVSAARRHWTLHEAVESPNARSVAHLMRDADDAIAPRQAPAAPRAAPRGAPPEPSESGEIAQLSTAAPLDPSASAPPRNPSADAPSWTREAEGLYGNEYRLVLRSDPFLSPSECEASLRTPLRRAVERYLDGFLTPGAGARMNLDDERLAALVGRRYVERYRSLTPDVEPMSILHEQVVIDDVDRAEFREIDQQRVLARKLGALGGVAAIVLAALGSAFAALRIDTATKGYYSGVLQLAVAGVILGLIGLGYFGARWYW